MRAAIRGRGPWELAFERLRRDRAALVSIAAIAAIVLVAILAPLFAALIGHPPNAQYRETGLSPSGIPVGPGRAFLFGTDGLGRDVLVRVAYGTRISLLVAVISSALAVLVGAIVGIAAGWFGGFVDAVLSRLMDVVLSLPFLVFALALVAVVGPSLTISIVVIAFFSWAQSSANSSAMIVRRSCSVPGGTLRLRSWQAFIDNAQIASRPSNCPHSNAARISGYDVIGCSMANPSSPVHDTGR